jgi:hypothetical protein
MTSGGGQIGDPDAYSGILATFDLPELRDAVYQAAVLFEADLKPQLASRARRAFISLVQELDRIAVDIARLARHEIVQEEVQSRVRPDTGGGGGPRLEDFLGESHPLPTLPGSVGINFEPVLEDNVPWWWTNEEGYDGLIGHEVRGFFFDSGFTAASAPNPDQFREHPLFRPGGRGPKMTVQDPIPERRFVQRGYESATAAWHARVAAARDRFDKESAAIWAAFHASP